MAKDKLLEALENLSEQFRSHFNNFEGLTSDDEIALDIAQEAIDSATTECKINKELLEALQEAVPYVCHVMINGAADERDKIMTKWTKMNEAIEKATKECKVVAKDNKELLDALEAVVDCFTPEEWEQIDSPTQEQVLEAIKKATGK